MLLYLRSDRQHVIEQKFQNYQPGPTSALIATTLSACGQAQPLSHIQLLQPHGLWPARLLCPWDSPGRSAGVGYHALTQGIFLIKQITIKDLLGFPGGSDGNESACNAETWV